MTCKIIEFDDTEIKFVEFILSYLWWITTEYLAE